MTPLEECNISINNMLTDTFTILQRHNSSQTKLLRETWIEFGIELDEINLETLEVLRAK